MTDIWTARGWDETDAGHTRRLLDEGADPDTWEDGRPLHHAAVYGTPEVVAELAARVTDVDATANGATALWEAVVSGRTDTARALAAAGADPWLSTVGDWSPGRLSLAGPEPDLFPAPPGTGLTDAEQAAAREAHRLIAALGSLECDGTGLACVAGIDAAEAVRRLAAAPASDEAVRRLADPYGFDLDEDVRVIGVTTVPGGCVVTQPWGYAPQLPGALARLSPGTVCYGLYANPKSGDQGSIARDGAVEGQDLHPGGRPEAEDGPEELLSAYLYQHHPVAYACAFAGLRPTDATPVTGPPGRWAELPERGQAHWPGRAAPPGS
ncbi:ankyrin repeat domain-containing protein [Streptomyces sp. HNM0574]|uniref:ankyrin repeat domain-containing protein n=1 Tax=Streptomyces sp. HNM0574 TaxID=2714954 RepID=UPI00146CB9E4|nr:ankyrin repeat domain-containing protein [Streptomyces sp. HNM0574]NLU69945.1 ankyrin repeat domain-containing protein [Streptomyces sp. HNM0574]